jgi:hypothetical protein
MSIDIGALQLYHIDIGALQGETIPIGEITDTIDLFAHGHTSVDDTITLFIEGFTTDEVLTLFISGYREGTRLYLPSSSSAPSIYPAISNTWDLSTPGGITCPGNTYGIRKCHTIKNNSAITPIRTTIECYDEDSDLDLIAFQYVSHPLTPGQTIYGGPPQAPDFRLNNFTIVYQGKEDYSLNSLVTSYIARIIGRDGEVRKILFDHARRGPEFPVGYFRSCYFGRAILPGNYVTVLGDCIVIEIGVAGNPVVGFGGTYDGYIRIGDPEGWDLSDDGNETEPLAPWAELSATLEFDGPGVVNADCDLFIHGRTTINDSLDLILTYPSFHIIALDLFLKAPEPINDSINLFTHNFEQITFSSDLFIHGYEQITDSEDLFIWGCASKNRSFTITLTYPSFHIIALDLFLHGYQQITADSDLFIYGHKFNTSDMDLFICGHQDKTTNIDLIISGKDSNNQDLNLFINGHEVDVNSIDLFIHGPEQITDSSNLFIHGYTTINDSFTLTLTYPSFHIIPLDLFLHGYQQITVNNDLFIYGLEQISDSSDLFIRGPESANISVNLFISGPSSGDDNFGQKIEMLYLKGDYYPQLMGRFTTAVISVTIEVWEVGEGVNTPITTLLDTDCYSIGNTGRWGWSTRHFREFYSKVNHFVFRMTGDNAEEFLGEFIITTGRSESHRTGKVNKNLNYQIDD